jgi:hypothetical protein
MGAAKGNKYAVNNEGGRPPLYNNPLELEKKIEAYFNGGANKRTIIVGKGENKQAIDIPILTITGLCYYLGFESRTAFYDYEKKEEFKYIIKKARLRIEQHYEESLQLDITPAGPIFVLKNMDWSDKMETDHKSSDGTMSPKPNIYVQSKEALDEINKLMNG